MKVQIAVRLEFYGDDLPKKVMDAVEIAALHFTEQLEAKFVDEVGPVVRKQYPDLKLEFIDADSFPPED